MAKPKLPVELADTSGLTDADWTEINKLKLAYDRGGQKALSRAIEELAADEIRYMRVIGAFFPEMIRERIRDEMAALGITVDDLREMIRRLESPSSKQH